MKSIVSKQNDEEFLALLRARKQTYRYARICQVVQFVLTVILPVASAVGPLFVPEARPAVALYALAVPIFDSAFLDRWYKQLLKKAAKIAEQFDCDLLGLPWDSFTVKDKVDIEDIVAASEKFSTHTNDEKLRDWYSPENNAKPHIARLICQRTNLYYDGKLRTLYSRMIVGIGVSTFAVLLGISWFQKLALQDFVLTVAPAIPVLSWAAREYYRQRDAFERAKELQGEIGKLFEKVKDNAITEDDCLAQSRLFQTGIYTWRVSSPLGVPYIYELNRARFERSMHSWTRELVKSFSPAKRKSE